VICERLILRDPFDGSRGGNSDFKISNGSYPRASPRLPTGDLFCWVCYLMRTLFASYRLLNFDYPVGFDLVAMVVLVVGAFFETSTWELTGLPTALDSTLPLFFLWWV